MATDHERDNALSSFDTAHDGFIGAVQRTPAEALRYRPAGEDYALGGLAVHVAQVLEKYTRVLEAMHSASGANASEPAVAESPEDQALIHDGFGDEQRGSVLTRVSEAHRAIAGALRNSDAQAFDRKVPVLFAGSTDAYPTSPSDVLGWVHAHYEEHITQIADLRQAWSGTPAGRS